MNRIVEEAERLFNVRISSDQERLLKQYEVLLTSWNEKINLTAIKNSEEIYIKHFLDSIACCLILNQIKFQTLIDIGTGAGFPGIVLKIMMPEIQVSLVESIGKKVDFCNLVIHELQLTSISVKQERAEVLGRDQVYREKFDVAIARAVAQLPVLCEYVLPFVKPGGLMIAMKGQRALEEIVASQHSLTELGSAVKNVVDYTLPGESDPRKLICIQKNQTLLKMYPRMTGVSLKNPL